MEPVEIGGRDDLAASFRGGAAGHALIEVLVRAGLVEVPAVFDEDLAKMLFAEHKDTVEALSSNGAQKALAECVCTRCSKRGLEHARADRLSSAVEVMTELVVPIADEEARPDPEGRRAAPGPPARIPLAGGSAQVMVLGWTAPALFWRRIRRL